MEEYEVGYKEPNSFNTCKEGFIEGEYNRGF